MHLVDEVRVNRTLPSPPVARMIRIAADVSQERLAQELGVHRMTVARWEAGTRGDLADDRVRTAYLLLHRAEARATTGRTRLGLDPLSAARLGRDRIAAQVDVARLMSDLERAERQRAERDDDTEGDDG